jgi:hypothetical protein
MHSIFPTKSINYVDTDGGIMKTSINLRLPALAVLAAVGVAACFGPLAGPEPPTIEDIEVFEVDSVALSAFSDSTFAESSFEAYGMVSAATALASFPLLYVEIALSEWDESQSSTYVDTSGVYTTTWAREGDTWTWTMTFTDGSVTTTVAITVTATESGWDVSVAIDGVILVQGLYSDDGASGLVTFFVDGVNAEKYVIEWGASSATGYDVNYTVTYYGTDGAVDTLLVLDYSADGTSGAWTYTDETGSSANAAGSWTP